MMKLINKAAAASLFIALGVGALLIYGAPVGAFLFALGLLAVCTIGCNLFTGKCGYINSKQTLKEGLIILLVNLITGWVFGFLIHLSSPDAVIAATAKIITWKFSLSFFIKSFFCGVVMFTAVDIYKRTNNFFGILLGVPLFILCGWQHCIANIITCGVAATFSPTIFLCIVGNWLGSLTIRYFSKN